MLHKFLHDVAERRAMRDPVYAAEAESRKIPGTNTSILTDKNHSVDDFFKHMDHFAELNPWWTPYITIRFHIREILYFPKKVKHFIQRGRRGYSDADVWALRHYLAKVIAGSTAQLRDIAHGYPIHPEDMTFEQWQRELTMISEGFKLHADDEEIEVPNETWKKLQSFYPALWD